MVVGRWDLVVRPVARAYAGRRRAGAELIEIPRAGHFVARDDPDVLATVVARYGDGRRSTAEVYSRQPIGGAAV